jgi:hypothetical protein
LLPSSWAADRAGSAPCCGSRRTEPNFNGQANSLWLYQNDMGALVYHAIQAMLAGPQTAVAA